MNQVSLSRRKSARRLLIVFGVAAVAHVLYAQWITHHNAAPMPSIPKPNVGAKITDPVFGVSVLRISDAAGSGIRGIVPQYSKRQAWNADGSRLLLLNADDGDFSLYDGNTYQFLRSVAQVGGEDVFWHPTDPQKIIYWESNVLMSADIATDVRTALHTFSQYAWGDTRGEGNLSNDGRTYAFCGQLYNETTGVVTFKDIVVYGIVGDQILKTLPLPQPLTDFDWVSISPLGNYVVVDYANWNTGRYNGVEVYDRQLNFLWQKPLGFGHSDLGLDANNDEVLIMDVYDEDLNTTFINKYRLADGTKTTLVEVSPLFDMHESCRNMNRKGWCFVSTFDSPGRLTDSSADWLPFEDEIFALKMDGSGDVQRIAHHHSRRFSPTTPDPDTSVYWAEPHATADRTGTRVLWGSNWRMNLNQVSGVDAYVADFSARVTGFSLSRNRLSFAALVGGARTSNQTVIVNSTGDSPIHWTATPGQSWIGVTPASGTGTGVLQVSVNPAGLPVGSHNGTITVSDASDINTARMINVTLQILNSGTSAVPFGDFATPINGTTGITGAIPVTGWVLDDVETKKVEIWRDPIGTEGSSLVYIGDGIFVEGARPDVETAYPAYPFNYRAGWGYMLLTNFLPAQGNGTYKLHAFATDKEGNQLLLGTKTITCDNAHAVKPFGTIDTPAQGGDTSGNPFVNFGWVLTPMPKTVPKDGSTIEVYVDGAKLGNLATAPNVYNQYRVDVSTNFPGFNNTGGPGAGGPVGAFYLDTTKLTNGVHTIYWIATDDQGAADGIGSRYFNVVNTGTSANVLSHCEPLGVAITQLDSILNLPPSFSPLSVKRGFDLTAPPETILPDTYGSIHIAMREVERVEIDLGKGTSYRGYLVVGDQLRPLPIGSTLNPLTGTFSWLPGPGFLGEYELVFVAQEASGAAQRIPVRVTIRPKFMT